MTGVNSGNKRQPKIGDIFYAQLDGIDSEQKGYRPCLVLQNNKGNLHSPNLIILPITSSIKRLDMPTHVLLFSRDSGLDRDSVVLCENPISISKRRLGKYVSSLSNIYMQQIATAHLLATSVIAFADPSSLRRIWNEANRMNAA